MSSPHSIEQKCWERLRQVNDPEIGCNIVDLGLIYSLAIHDGIANVSMTFTTAGCPMHESIIAGVQASLMLVEEIASSHVNVVWEPAWTPEMMTSEGRRLINGG